MFYTKQSIDLATAERAIAGAIIGAIDLSGGHYSQDLECARAGLSAINRPE
jgi:uncharacterized protein GlcG (DUF336 family)